MFRNFEEYLNKIEPCKLKINILHDLGYKNKSSEFDYINPINLYQNSLIVGDNRQLTYFQHYILDLGLDDTKFFNLDFKPNNLKNSLITLQRLNESVMKTVTDMRMDGVIEIDDYIKERKATKHVVVIRGINILPDEILKKLDFIFKLSRSTGTSIFTLKEKSLKHSIFENCQHLECIIER